MEGKWEEGEGGREERMRDRRKEGRKGGRQVKTLCWKLNKKLFKHCSHMRTMSV